MTPLQIVFLLTALVILVAAWQVVTTRNLVHAALWLIVTLFGMAILFVLLEAGFLAVVQVVVYIGAISILIIFAIMLTRRVMQDSGSQTNRYWPVAVVIAALLFVGIGVTIIRAERPEVAQAAVPQDSLATLGLQLTSTEFYVVPLVVVGALLAVGMIGSIAIARDDKQE